MKWRFLSLVKITNKPFAPKILRASFSKYIKDNAISFPHPEAVKVFYI